MSNNPSGWRRNDDPKLTDKFSFTTNIKSAVAIIGLIILCAVGWTEYALTSTSHGQRLDRLESAIPVDHDQLTKVTTELRTLGTTLERIENKIDNAEYRRAVARGGNNLTP